MKAKQLALDLFSADNLPAPGESSGAVVAPLAPRAELPEHRDLVVTESGKRPSGQQQRQRRRPDTLSEISGGEPTDLTATVPLDSPDPFWVAWLARPHTPQTRLDDLVLQIRRDLAVLRESRDYHPDDSFYEERIASCREEAARLMSQLKLEG